MVKTKIHTGMSLLTVMLMLALFLPAQFVSQSGAGNDLPENLSVAVLELQPRPGVSKNISRMLTETLRSVLVNSWRFTVLDQQEMLTRLVDAKVEQTIFTVDTGHIVEIGRILDVPYIIAGRVSMEERKFVLTLRLLDVDKAVEIASVDVSRVCSTSELPLLVKQTVLNLLMLIDQNRATPTSSPTVKSSPRATRTPTPTPTPTTGWYKKWYAWGLGALAIGGAVIVDQTRPGPSSPDPTLTPTITQTPTSTQTPIFKVTMTPTVTPTWTPTPTFGCNPAGFEAYVSDIYGEFKFYINCYESQNQQFSLPENDVTWYQAATQCLEQGNGRRLCNRNEWQLACRGKSGNYFPYGNEYDPDKCHTEQDPYVGPFGSGTKEDCVSSFGVYDMSGNVSEWSATAVKIDTGDDSKHYKLGGDWTSEDEFGCYNEKEWGDDASNIWTGYRCCRDVDTKTADTSSSNKTRKKSKKAIVLPEIKPAKTIQRDDRKYPAPKKELIILNE